MKKVIVSSSIVLLLAAGTNSFAGGGIKPPKIKKVGTQVGRVASKVGRTLRRKATTPRKVTSAQVAQARRAVSTSTRTTTGLTTAQANLVERKLVSAQSQEVPLVAKTQGQGLIKQTLATLDKRADEYICTFGFADQNLKPLYKEDGAFVSIGDKASVVEVGTRINEAHNARPQARYLILQTRKPFSALPRVEMPEFLQGSALYEENLPRVVRNLKEYVYDLKDNTLISVSKDLPELPEGETRFILDGLE